MVASAPTETKETVINVDGPNGRHVQTGEPGKSVSGYFTWVNFSNTNLPVPRKSIQIDDVLRSRSADGVEYRTTYEADEKGFRANGLHLPVSSARLPAAFPLRYATSAYPSHGFRYGPQNYLPFYYPTYPQGKRWSIDLRYLTDWILKSNRKIFCGWRFPFVRQHRIQTCGWWISSSGGSGIDPRSRWSSALHRRKDCHSCRAWYADTHTYAFYAHEQGKHDDHDACK